MGELFCGTLKTSDIPKFACFWKRFCKLLGIRPPPNQAEPKWQELAFTTAYMYLVDVKGPYIFPMLNFVPSWLSMNTSTIKCKLWFIDTLNMVVHYRNDLVTRVIISDIMAST